jgi:hypothetical protein
VNAIRVGTDRHHVLVHPGGADGDDLNRCTLTCPSHGPLDLSPAPLDVAVVAADLHITQTRPILSNFP